MTPANDPILVGRVRWAGARRCVGRVGSGHATVGVARLLFDAVSLGVQGRLGCLGWRSCGLSFQGIGLNFSLFVSLTFTASSKPCQSEGSGGSDNKFTHQDSPLP